MHAGMVDDTAPTVIEHSQQIVDSNYKSVDSIQFALISGTNENVEKQI